MTRWLVAGAVSNSVSLDDRGFRYGHGLFETIAVRAGTPRFLDQHLDRLERGARVLGISLPPRADIRRLLARAVDAERATAALTLRLIVTAGNAPRGYRPAEDPAPTLAVGVDDAAFPPAAAYGDGVRIRFCDTTIAEQPALAGIKSLNRLEQILARAEWDDANIFEGLMRDAAGHLICGTMSNVFIVINQKLSTPDLRRCGVDGIMRRQVIELGEETGYPVEIRDIRAAELADADEVFLTNSQFGLLPVNACGDDEWPIGQATRSIMNTLAANGVPEVRP